jgi:hypothetical protein
MRIITDYKTQLPSKTKCIDKNCDVKYIITQTCNSSTYCPVCDKDNENFEDNMYDMFDGDDRYQTGNASEYIDNYRYCPFCKIMFLGTIHSGGCYSETATFIKKFKINGTVYKGMPKFDNNEEYFKTLLDVTFIILETEPIDNRPVPQRYCKHDSDKSEFGEII